MASFWGDTYRRPQTPDQWVNHLSQNYTGEPRRVNVLRWSPSRIQRLRGRLMANGFIYTVSSLTAMILVCLAAGFTTPWMLIVGVPLVAWLLAGATFNVTVSPRDIFVLDRMGECLRAGRASGKVDRSASAKILHRSAVKLLNYRSSAHVLPNLLAQLPVPQLPPLPDHGSFAILEKTMEREPYGNIRGTYVVLTKGNLELAFTAMLWDGHRRLEPVTPCCGSRHILADFDHPRCGVCRSPYLGLSRHRLNSEPSRSPLVKEWRANDVMGTDASIRELLNLWYNLDPVTEELSMAILKGHLEWDPADA